MPVYLEKIKGARLVYYRDEDNANNTVSRVLVGLVFAVLCTLWVCVWDRAWESQSLYATITFSVALVQVLVFTYRLSKRVLGANTTGACTCDHVQQHDDAWRVNVEKSEHGDGLIEAGTVVNWGLEYASGVQKFHGDNLDGEHNADRIVDHLLLVQWDCGYRKVYSKIKEWKLLRVFDMGPTGTLVHRL